MENYTPFRLLKCSYTQMKKSVFNTVSPTTEITVLPLKGQIAIYVKFVFSPLLIRLNITTDLMPVTAINTIPLAKSNISL